MSEQGQSKSGARRRRGGAPKRDLKITVRSEPRNPADYRKFATALLSLAQAEADAQALYLESLNGQDTPKEAA